MPGSVGLTPKAKYDGIAEWHDSHAPASDDVATALKELIGNAGGIMVDI